MIKWVVFGQELDLESVSPEELNHLFSLAKKSINRFRIVSYDNSKFDYCETRRQVQSLLDFCDKISNELLVQTILDEGSNLLTFLGKISSILELDLAFLESLKNPKSLSYNYFYLTVDVWWKTYKIFSHFGSKSTNHQDYSQTLAQIIYYDLVTLSFLPLKLAATMESILSTSPFVCDVQKDLYIQLLKDFDDRVVTSDHPFWFIVNPILSSLIETDKKPFDHGDRIFSVSKYFDLSNIGQDPFLAVLWFSGFALEMLENSSFTPSNKQSSCNSGILVKALNSAIKAIESSSHMKLLEISLQLTIKITRHCDPCVDLLLPFIEFFRKESIQNSTLPANRTVPLSAYAWSRKIQMVIESPSLPESHEKSFDLYLRLLNRTVTKLCESSDRNCVSHWQKIKGRLSSQTLQPRRIESMDLFNLYKTCSTFIILKCAAEESFPEFVDRLDFIVKVLYPKLNTDPQFGDKISIVAKAFFCMIHLQNSNQYVKDLITHVSAIFEQICGVLGPVDPQVTDPRQGLVTDFVVFYGEELISLVEMKGDLISCYELIPEKAQVLLSKLVDRDLQAFMKVVAELVRTVREALLRSLDDSFMHNFKPLLCNILARFLPFVRSQFVNRNSQFNLGGVAVDLTLLVLLKEPGRISFNEFKENFIFFSCSKSSGYQSEQYCDLILKSDISILQEQLKFLFPDLLSRYVLSDANGQAVVDRVLNKLIPHIKARDSNIELHIKSCLKEFLGQELFRKSSAKIFKVLQTCTLLLPGIKSELVSHIAQQIHIIEKENPVGIMETLRQEFSKFFHS